MVGAGIIGTHASRADGAWLDEEERPGPGWHRHDWKPRRLLVLTDSGVGVATVLRRRWRLHGTTNTRLDRSPDEVGRRHVLLLVLLVKLWAWLSSGFGVHAFDELHPALEGHGSRRTVQRWLRTVLPDAVRLQQALPNAVIERFRRLVERVAPFVFGRHRRPHPAPAETPTEPAKAAKGAPIGDYLGHLVQKRRAQNTVEPTSHALADALAARRGETDDAVFDVLAARLDPGRRRGSANFTLGGLERNLELGVRVEGDTAERIVRTVEGLVREGWLVGVLTAGQ